MLFNHIRLKVAVACCTLQLSALPAISQPSIFSNLDTSCLPQSAKKTVAKALQAEQKALAVKQLGLEMELAAAYAEENREYGYYYDSDRDDSVACEIYDGAHLPDDDDCDGIIVVRGNISSSVNISGLVWRSSRFNKLQGVQIGPFSRSPSLDKHSYGYVYIEAELSSYGGGSPAWLYEQIDRISYAGMATVFDNEIVPHGYGVIRAIGRESVEDKKTYETKIEPSSHSLFASFSLGQVEGFYFDPLARPGTWSSLGVAGQVVAGEEVDHTWIKNCEQR